MARRENGAGTYVHITPVNCRVCRKREECTLQGVPGSKCSLRDRVDRWMYQYIVYMPDGTKKRKSMYARTRRELQDKVAALLETKGPAFSKKSTLGQWLDMWKSRYLLDTVKASTRDFYSDCLKYVPTKIKDMQLSEIEPVMLQEMFSELLASGSIKNPGGSLSPTTVRSVRTTLITAIDCAIDNGFLGQNPARKTKPPQKSKRQISYLSKDEMKRLLKVAESGEYYDGLEQALDIEGCRYLMKQWATLIRLTLETGLRRGEVFGLAWEDIDFDKRIINVHSNLQAGRLVEPKTPYSRRYVSIDKGTVQKLKEWKGYQQKYGDSIGDMFNNKMKLVFTNILGHPVNFATFRSRYFAKMVKKAMLPCTVTFHSLRHTHATQLLAAGIDAKTISTRLGHSSVAFTLQTYVHTTPETEMNAANVMGSILDVPVKKE